MYVRDGVAYERFRHLAEVPMLVLALAFLPVLVLPITAELTPTENALLHAASWAIWGAFVCEYLILLALAPDRRAMVRSHVIDLVIIALPFLRPLRALRVVRLARVFVPVGRAALGLRRVGRRRGVRLVLITALVCIFAGGVSVYAFEHRHPGTNIHTVLDGLWWALVTIASVGYGDHFPVSGEGRIVAITLMIASIGMFSVVTATVAAYFVDQDEGVTLDHIDERLGRIEAQLAAAIRAGLLERDLPAHERASRPGEGSTPAANAAAGAAIPDARG